LSRRISAPDRDRNVLTVDSFEATPLVKDGVMYVSTGNDDAFALNAKTGEILWERWSGIDQKITSVCCGWVNRGLAMGEGMLFLRS
jgi:alcohol dehydrogenase (cytochrome c)